MPAMEILPPLDAPADREAIGAAGIVHDLGNLIQLASSAINILARSPDMPAGDAAAVLRRARTSLDHAGEIVRADLARRREQAAPRRSEVGTCLAAVARLVEAMDEPGLRLEFAIASDMPPMRCDPHGLCRAIFNLILNARDAMAGNGVVRIEAAATGRTVELRVTDHGIGMAPDIVKRVFDPFFTTKNGSGGVGLPMVARFVRDAGGEVIIDSEPERGTSVTLRLPTIARQNVLP